jgi:hypothetical protein
MEEWSKQMNPMRLPFEFVMQLRENFSGQWLYVDPNGLIVAYDDPMKLIIDVAAIITAQEKQRQKKEEEK